MTDTVKDPRIEAVAKLLFTGPLFQNNDGDWDDATSYALSRSQCLMAAEDVLRGIDEAGGWEYGVRLTDEVHPFSKEETARSWTGEYGGQALRRRPAGEWEPLPKREAEDER